MSERVLLVEDDPLDAALARRALRAAGVTEVEHCSTLGDTLERLADPERPRPTVLLLDLTLPDSDGIETFDRLAAASPPPVVVMSGDEDPLRALALIERGAQDYLVKGEMSGAAIARSLRLAVERARLSEELREARDHALIAARSQSAFVAAMSHEIRTPLNAILGMSELLAQTRLDLDQREYVEIFRRCGRALKGLLDNALELSRFESGRIELAHEPFELDALVQECVESFAFAAHRQGLALVADVTEDAVGSVVGDEGRLRQVLFNLVGNAVKFTSAGRVVVRVRQREGETGVVFEVSDTGIGIPADRLDAVFERFVQAESGTTRRYGGSGLGLALCRELVEAMGGSIGVESETGRGSTFRVELPLRVEPRARGAALHADAVLVLLDDPVERAALAAGLRARGARTAEFARVSDAERALRDERFDALLIDARLRGEGGLELIEQRDVALPARAVVLLPMDHRAGDLARCEAAGAVALCKPARWEDLLDALRGEAPRRTSKSPSGAPELAGRTVLIAEDAPENRAVVLAHLAPTGCAVVVAEDGAEAVARCAERRVDLVLMDLHMPRIDGCEAARRIRAAERAAGRPRVPIVALTADALPEQRAACLTAGCDAHLGKPFTREGRYGLLTRFLGGAALPASPAPAPVPAPAPDADEEIPAEIADLAEEYLENRRGDAAKLRRAVAAGALDDARRVGHNMKGSGAGYGFARVTEIGSGVEQAAARGDAAAVARLAEALDEYAAKRLADLRGSG